MHVSKREKAYISVEYFHKTGCEIHIDCRIELREMFIKHTVKKQNVLGALRRPSIVTLLQFTQTCNLNKRAIMVILG